MRIHEAIVRGLESVGVDAAFGGAGENAAGMMIALKHSKKIHPVITRNEQGAAFAACGYAMFTNKLGVCWATAGPGAFNLFSGLAVAMSDSYPLLAISGYASLDWRGKGSLNETSGVNRTPDSQEMFAATTKKSWLLTDVADTMDVLEEAVNLAFEGRPGPVHIHVPENLTHHGVEVNNYRDLRLVVKPVLPDPARVAEIADYLADAFAKDKKVVALVGFGAIRSGAGAGGAPADRALPAAVAHHARRQGHRRGKPSAGGRRVLRQRPRHGLEGVPRCRRGDRRRQFAQSARHVRLSRRTCSPIAR